MPRDVYQSPFSTRYASREMQHLFSEEHKFRTWRRLWVALAEAEQAEGLAITDGQIAELKAYINDVNYEDAMRREAQCAVGRHDFRAFAASGSVVKDTVRTIHSIEIARQGKCVSMQVRGNGFLYNMVRAITGTVLYAAEGKLTAEDIPRILDAGNRTLAGPTVPPGGLYLTKLWYEDERLNG